MLLFALWAFRGLASAFCGSFGNPAQAKRSNGLPAFGPSIPGLQRGERIGGRRLAYCCGVNLKLNVGARKCTGDLGMGRGAGGPFSTVLLRQGCHRGEPCRRPTESGGAGRRNRLWNRLWGPERRLLKRLPQGFSARPIVGGASSQQNIF